MPGRTQTRGELSTPEPHRASGTRNAGACRALAGDLVLLLARAEEMRAMEQATTIQIRLTREQELQIAAATGLLVGTLELDVADLEEGEVASATVPEALLEAPRATPTDPLAGAAAPPG